MSGGGVLVAAPVDWREACFSVPAVRAIRHARPRALLGVLCVEGQAPLWQSVGVDRVVSYPERAGERVLAGMLLGGGQGWDSAVIWEAGVAADACVRAGIAERCGRADGGLAKRLTRQVAVVERVGPVEHRVRHYLGLVAAMGMEAFVPRNFEVAAVAERDPRAVVLAPDSDYGPSHEWALERWTALARELSALPLSRLTVAGIAGGRGLGRALAGALGGEPPVDWREFRALGDALPVLVAHGVWVGVDSSLAHLAAHAGSVCVTLFGPGEAAWRRPLGRRNVVVRRQVECAPCMLASCPLDLRCQRELTVAEVLEAVRGRLAQADA